MIVDRINKYLSENNLILNDALRYEIEKLAGVSFRRQFMEENETTPGKLRLSSAGRCARQIAYGYHGIEKKGKETDSRSKIVFFQGDLVELMLTYLARLSGCNLIATGLNQAKVQFPVNGTLIDGHPDGILIEPDELFLTEFKSMSSYSFDKFERGEIEESYLTQISVYMECLKLNRCVLVAMDKDSGVIGEHIITKDPALVEQARLNLLAVLKSTSKTIPPPKYAPNDKGFYPWNCLYCSWWGVCHPNAEKILCGKSYRLKEKKQ